MCQKVEFHADPAQRPAVRPAREAQILRALLSAERQGARDLLVIRVWRELMADSLSLQGPYDLAVWGGKDAGRTLELARLRFGIAPTLRQVAKPEDALAAAREARAACLAQGMLDFGQVEAMAPQPQQAPERGRAQRTAQRALGYWGRPFSHGSCAPPPAMYGMSENCGSGCSTPMLGCVYEPM